MIWKKYEGAACGTATVPGEDVPDEKSPAIHQQLSAPVAAGIPARLTGNVPQVHVAQSGLVADPACPAKYFQRGGRPVHEAIGGMKTGA